MMRTSSVFHCHSVASLVTRSTLFLFLFLFVGAFCASAQSKKDLEKQKSKIEQEIKKLNNELSQAKKKSKQSTKQLDILDKKIKERTKLINNINGQMNSLSIEIGKAQDSIVSMRSRIDSLKVEYAHVLRVLYSERNNLNKMVLLVDNESYNRTYLRMKYFREYSRYRAHQAKFIKDRQQEMENMQLDLQRQKNEKSVLLQQENNNKKQLAKEQQQQQKSYKTAKQREQQLAKQLTQKENQKKQLQQQIQRIINEEIAKAAAAKKKASTTTNKTAATTTNTTTTTKTESVDAALSANFVDNKGRLSWPVSYTKVTREYGTYNHSSGGKNMNNGIDLVTPAGTAVYAVFDGVVSRVFTCPNGTKGIIIRHGDYMSVYANLGSVAVSEGSKVKTRQSIGTVYIASDGTSEFSFQLWNGQQSQNPRNWLR